MDQLSFDFARVQPFIVAERRDEELKLRLGEFDGPLDLLLHLIKQEQVNIYDIPIARITDEYLRYLKLMETLDIAVAGDFLVVAAQLLEIKSRMLLPRLTESEETAAETDADDPRRELVERLLEHQKFKTAAQMLWTKATVEGSVFARGKIETDDQAIAQVSIGVFDLLETFQKILSRRKQEVQLEIEREEITLAEMLEKLKERLMAVKELNLTEFFADAQTKRELVARFLAVLELVRSASVRLIQRETFGDIIALNAPNL